MDNEITALTVIFRVLVLGNSCINVSHSRGILCVRGWGVQAEKPFTHL